MKRSPQGDKLYPSNSALSTVLGYVSQIDDKFAACFVAEMVGNDIIDAYRLSMCANVATPSNLCASD